MQKAGGVPLVVWVIAGGAGVVMVVKSRSSGSSTVTREVQQVAVPVGAVGAVDNAPTVVSPVIRINVPEVDKLVGAITGNTSALGVNTGALGANSGALGVNTGALNAGTDATIANTGATSGLSGVVGGLTGAVAGLTTQIGNIPAPVAPAPTPTPAAAAARTYLIRSGDTLSAIAQRYTGNANRWPELYNRNASTIDSVARSRGKAGGGKWIFPGTTLVIPW